MRKKQHLVRKIAHEDARVKGAIDCGPRPPRERLSLSSWLRHSRQDRGTSRGHDGPPSRATRIIQSRRAVHLAVLGPACIAARVPHEGTLRPPLAPLLCRAARRTVFCTASMRAGSFWVPRGRWIRTHHVPPRDHDVVASNAPEMPCSRRTAAMIRNRTTRWLQREVRERPHLDDSLCPAFS